MQLITYLENRAHARSDHNQAFEERMKQLETQLKQDRIKRKAASLFKTRPARQAA